LKDVLATLEKDGFLHSEEPTAVDAVGDESVGATTGIERDLLAQKCLDRVVAIRGMFNKLVTTQPVSRIAGVIGIRRIERAKDIGVGDGVWVVIKMVSQKSHLVEEIGDDVALSLMGMA
jgi:hypothetical protein